MSFVRLRRLGMAVLLFTLLITASSTASAQWGNRGGRVYGGGFGHHPAYSRPYYSSGYSRYPRVYRRPVYIPPSYSPSGYGLPNAVGPRPVVMNPGFFGY
jgi:hypothetical protein